MTLFGNRISVGVISGSSDDKESACNAGDPGIELASLMPPALAGGFFTTSTTWEAPPWWISGKECTCQCRRHGFNTWVRKIPWRRKWQPTPVFSPGKSHGQRSLAGYSPGVTKSWTRLSKRAVCHLIPHHKSSAWLSWLPLLLQSCLLYCVTVTEGWFPYCL